MACTPALACKALLSQATARWPRRSRASDGICPSAAHSSQNPDSDHELGNAADLTHDPARGCDAHAWARDLVARRDSRVTYVISDGRIATAAPIARHPAWAWRTYSGINPHRTHVHVSIKGTARGDVSPWFVDSAPPLPTPSPITLTEEDDMLIAGDGTSAWLISGGRRIWIQSPAELAALKSKLPYVEAPVLVAATPVARAE